MSNMWQDVRKKMKQGIRQNFKEIRKIMGYKNEESLSKILGVTRQTLSNFGDPYERADNPNNTMLISILTLMEQFLYTNRYDYDNLEIYLQKFDQFLFGDLFNCEKLRNYIEFTDLFLLADYEKLEYRYIEVWLKTFQYELAESTIKEDKTDDDTKLTIRKMIDKYTIYITSDFLLYDQADIFFDQLLDIMLKRTRKIRISNFTIDMIQNSRIAIEYETYKNGRKALEIINCLDKIKCLARIKSNPDCKNEIELIISEILSKNINNAIVLSQESSHKILSSINCSGSDFITRMVVKGFRVLSLTLNDEDIDINKGLGYKICALPSDL